MTKYHIEEMNKWLAKNSNRILSEPIVNDCKFKVGDIVTYTNDYGVVFPGHKIIGFDNGDCLTFEQGSHIYIDFDCYWSPVKSHSLTLA